MGAKDSDGQLLGYLLYAAYSNRFRIAHLCVSREIRGQGLAGRLIDALIETATTQTVITLSCRNDFEAHKMWPKLGFVPLYEKVGRSREGLPLTVWRRIIALDNQLGLFQANVSDDVLDVIIDAQVFFDFDAPDSEHAQPSKTLLSDIFIDAINLWITDELLTEIYRNDSPEGRDSRRWRATQFPEVKYDPLFLEYFVELLKDILPNSNPSQISDINHLAKAASSDVHVFITRDNLLLNKAEQIRALVNVEVISPTVLILRARELSEKQTPVPDRVAGLGLEWRRLNSSDFTAFPFQRFLLQGEKLNQLRQRLGYLLASQSSDELEVLWAQNEPVAFRILKVDGSTSLTLSLGRVENSRDQSLFGGFLVSDVVYRAMRNGLSMVKVKADALPRNLIHSLSYIGFIKCNGDFLRFCFAQYLDRVDALTEIGNLAPEAVEYYQSISAFEFDRRCSPLLSNANQNCFLVPIRQRYALNLFDRALSAQGLFGGDENLLMRWSNIYYRRNNRHRMFQAPGRILWYVSGTRKAIVAVSHLDEVVIDIPKELFRRFRKFGTLAWGDLYELCEGDVSKKLMALRFSHTFPLQTEVPLKEIKSVFNEDGIGLSLQGPIRVPCSSLRRLYQLGYPR